MRGGDLAPRFLMRTLLRIQRRTKRPLAMGILNVTPDSFSDGGKFSDAQAAVRHAIEMVQAGADVIDVGGESTRPGAAAVALDEELARTIPVIARLAAAVHVPLSIDTSKAEVARQALRAGASIVNDVTALRGDAAMASVAAVAGAQVILMHMRGSPRTMQKSPRYSDVVRDVAAFLRDAARRAMNAGIVRDRIWLDPGIGFGKTVTHNLLLLRRLKRIRALGFPVVVGASRKSFIGKSLKVAPDERLIGSLACVAAAQANGAAMVRVHDVAQTRQLIDMLKFIEDAKALKRP